MTIQHARVYQATYLNMCLHLWLRGVLAYLFMNYWIASSQKSPLIRHSKLCGSKYFSPLTKNIICGIIYRHHDSPDDFPTDFEENIEKFSSTNKALYIMGDFNIDLLKCETFHFTHNLFLHLQSCYLIPAVDKLYEFTEPQPS